MYNKPLSKLLFEDQTVTVSNSKEEDSSNTGQEKEQRLQIRSAIPDEKMMSDNTISHADLMTKVGPKICEMFIKSKEVAECIDVWTQVAVEADKEENKKLSTDELVAKMNKKGQSLYKKYREIAESNPLGCIDKNIMKSLFVKNTSLGQFGKVHLNYFQAKSGTDQVEGATATDLPIYTELQVIPFFLSDDSSETFTSESKGKKNLIMGFKGAEGAFIKKENHKFYNTLMISEPSKKIVSEDQVFFGQQTIPFIYVEPDELPQIQANPREVIPKLFGLASSRKGNTTNLEREQEQAATQTPSDTTQQSSSQGDSEITGESTWIYKRGLNMLLNENESGDGQTVVIEPGSSVEESSPSDVLTNENKAFIQSNSAKIVENIVSMLAQGNEQGESQDEENFFKKYLKNKFFNFDNEASANRSVNHILSAVAIGGIGSALFLGTGLGIPLALTGGTYTFSDRLINLGYDIYNNKKIKEINKEHSAELNKIPSAIESLIETGLEKQANAAAANAKELTRSSKVIHKYNKVDIKFLDSFELSGTQKDSLLIQVNSILLTFNIEIEDVEQQPIRQAITQQFVKDILDQRKVQADLARQREQAARERLGLSKADRLDAEAEKERAKTEKAKLRTATIESNNELKKIEIEQGKEAAKLIKDLINAVSNNKSNRETLNDLLNKLTNESNNQENNNSQSDSYVRKGNLVTESSVEFSKLASSIDKIKRQLKNDNVYNFLKVIKLINNSNDEKLLNDMFSFFAEDPNNLNRVFDNFVKENLSFEEAIKQLGDDNNIIKLIRQNKDEFKLKEKKSKSKKGLKNKKEDKSLKSESFDVRDEWLKIWNVKK